MTSRTLNYDAATFKASAAPRVPEERFTHSVYVLQKKKKKANKNPLKAHHYWSDNSSKTLFDLRAGAWWGSPRCRGVLLILLMWPERGACGCTLEPLSYHPYFKCAMSSFSVQVFSFSAVTIGGCSRSWCPLSFSGTPIVTLFSERALASRCHYHEVIAWVYKGDVNCPLICAKRQDKFFFIVVFLSFPSLFIGKIASSIYNNIVSIFL